MIDFSKLKNKAFKQKLMEKTKNANKSDKKVDERIYKPMLADNNDDNIVDVRLLPSKFEDRDCPGSPQTFVEAKKHWFKEGNQPVNVDCPRSIGKDCPLCNSLKGVWNANDPESQDLYSRRKARSKFFCNVYIINDREHPENNGKVRILEFGPQIFKTMQESAKDENLPNMWSLDDDGATFRIKIKCVGVNSDNKKPRPNYQSSAFRNPSDFLDGDEERQMEIFEQTYDLTEFVAFEKYRTYEEIEKYLASRLGDDIPVVEEVREYTPPKPVKREEPKPKVNIEEELENDSDDMSDDDIDKLLEEIS